VITGSDPRQAFDEFEKIGLFRSAQGMAQKERYDGRPKVVPPADDISAEKILMVVMPGVDEDLTDPEETSEEVQHLNAPRTLRDCKFVRNLDAESVAISPRSLRLPHETDGKAALTINKTQDPADFQGIIESGVR
jgi:hypothetical protein